MFSNIAIILQEFSEQGGPPAEQATPSPGGFSMFLPFIIIIAIFYFLIIRPQRKQQKQRAAMLSQVQKGDRVLTSGGVFGKVMNLKEHEVTLEVADNVRIRFSRQAVTQVIKTEGKQKELINQ